MCIRLACGEMADEWTTWKDFEMFPHSHKLEVLLGDLECRYGIDHPMARDVRAALPKVAEPLSRTSRASLLEQKPAPASRPKEETSAAG
jgi:hypothetical protein